VRPAGLHGLPPRPDRSGGLHRPRVPHLLHGGLRRRRRCWSTGRRFFRSRKYVLGLPVVPPERKGKRVGIFLSTAGQTWENVFDAAIPSVKCFFNVIDVRGRDIRYLMVNGVDEKGAIDRHPPPCAMQKPWQERSSHTCGRSAWHDRTLKSPRDIREPPAAREHRDPA